MIHDVIPWGTRGSDANNSGTRKSADVTNLRFPFFHVIRDWVPPLDPPLSTGIEERNLVENIFRQIARAWEPARAPRASFLSVKHFAKTDNKAQNTAVELMAAKRQNFKTSNLQLHV